MHVCMNENFSFVFFLFHPTYLNFFHKCSVMQKYEEVYDGYFVSSDKHRSLYSVHIFCGGCCSLSFCFVAFSFEIISRAKVWLETGWSRANWMNLNAMHKFAVLSIEGKFFNFIHMLLLWFHSWIKRKHNQKYRFHEMSKSFPCETCYWLTKVMLITPSIGSDHGNKHWKWNYMYWMCHIKCNFTFLSYVKTKTIELIQKYYPILFSVFPYRFL